MNQPLHTSIAWLALLSCLLVTPLARAADNVRTLKVPPQTKAEAVRTRAQFPECRWTGQRIVRFLLRDDIIAARDHLHFYDVFTCPATYLTQAFGCAVTHQKAIGSGKKDDLVSACWETLLPPQAAAVDAP